ncbi:MAG: hypothetical protein EOO66_00655 [Methylobacterium sp.]|nr:MAG: hypothetical protein EOO66_00655 [Methylobacterium sp.]
MRKPASKTTAAFMPSPRPRPRTSPEDAQLLAAATGDLGFTRASNAPEAAGKPRPKPSKAQEPKTPLAPLDGAVAEDAPAQDASPEEIPAKESSAKEIPVKQAGPAPRASSLKFEVPDQVWFALRQEALNRRVTVRYLVLEALAAKGYAVDLSAVPEDGRRLR